MLSGIVFINRNGLRRCDAPREYGPHKTLCNRWKRWSEIGVFARILVGLVPESRKGNGLDNARMESFFHTLKVECGHRRVHATRDEARRDPFAWIERVHSSRRLHSATGCRSPADLERLPA